jgi:hypothetical protein
LYVSHHTTKTVAELDVPSEQKPFQEPDTPLVNKEMQENCFRLFSRYFENVLERLIASQRALKAQTKANERQEVRIPC